MNDHMNFEDHLPVKIRNIHQQALQASARYKTAEIDLINILDQVEQNRVYLRYGYNSLFQYGVQCLGLSDGVVYALIAVTRKSREVPELKEEIKEGRLTVSKAKRITSVINNENKTQWLELAKTSTQSKVEREVAKANPQEARKGKMTYVHPQNEIQEKVAIQQQPTAVRVQLQVGISERLMIKIRRAQDLMSQKAQKPANLEATLESIVDLFLAKHDPLKKAERQMIRGKLSRENQSTSAPIPDNQGSPEISVTEAKPELSLRRAGEVAASKETPDREIYRDGKPTTKKPAHLTVDQLNNDSPLSDSRSDCRAISGNPNPRRRAGRIRTAAAKLTQSEDAPAADKACEDLRRMVGNGLNHLIKVSANQQLGGPVNTNRTKTTGRKRKPLPAATKHRVMLKFAGQCSHENHQGERCRETKFLEIHHLKPIALGGGDHLENLTLLCSGHHRAQHLSGTSTLSLPG